MVPLVMNMFFCRVGKEVMMRFLFLTILLWNGCGQRSDTVVSIVLHPTKPHIVYVATNEAVYKTWDDGQTWAPMQGELKRTRVLSLAIDPQLPANIFAGTMGDGTYKSPDGGKRWLPSNAGLHKGTISSVVNHIVFNPVRTQTLYAATTTGIFKSQDGGHQWTEQMRGMTEINFVVSLAIDPQRPNLLYAGTSGGVYRSRNGAGRWEKVTTGMVPPDTKMASMALGINSLVIHPVKTDTVYAGTTKGLFQTVDQGEHWKRIGKRLEDAYISGIQVDPTNPQILYVATSEGVQKSLDGGETWTLMNIGLKTMSIRTIQLDQHHPRTLYIGTNGSGLYRSVNGGETWTHLPLSTAVKNG